MDTLTITESGTYEGGVYNRVDVRANDVTLRGVQVRDPQRGACVSIGPDVAVMENIPRNITIDACDISGDCLHGVAANGYVVSITRCNIDVWNTTKREAHAVQFFNTPGRVTVADNILSASGIGVLIGGSRPRIDGLAPQDNIITRNVITRRFDATMIMKHGIEIKSGSVTIRGNVICNVFTGYGVGDAAGIYLKPTQQGGTGAPWQWVAADVSDNVIMNVANGIRLATSGEGATGGLRYVSLTGNRVMVARGELLASPSLTNAAILINDSGVAAIEYLRGYDNVLRGDCTRGIAVNSTSGPAMIRHLDWRDNRMHVREKYESSDLQKYTRQIQ